MRGKGGRIGLRLNAHQFQIRPVREADERHLRNVVGVQAAILRGTTTAAVSALRIASRCSPATVTVIDAQIGRRKRERCRAISASARTC